MQASDLRTQIISLTYESKMLKVELLSLQNEIDCFLKEYIEAVGDLSAQLSELETKITGYEDKINGFTQAEEPKTSLKRTRGEFFDTELKTLHRKLIKMVHPDLSKQNTYTKYSQKVTEAYNKSDMLELVKLEIEITASDYPPMILQKTYNNLVDENYHIKIQIEQLKESPEYLLKCKFDHIGALKTMAIAEVRANLRKRIEEAKQQLLMKKITYIEAMQKKIVA